MPYKKGGNVDESFVNVLKGRGVIERGTKRAVKKIRANVQKRRAAKALVVKANITPVFTSEGAKIGTTESDIESMMKSNPDLAKANKKSVREAFKGAEHIETKPGKKLHRPHVVRQKIIDVVKGPVRAVAGGFTRRKKSK